MKSLIYLIGFAAAAFFCWNHFQPRSEPTGEQQIQAIAESGHADAKQLAALAKKHPSLLTQALRGRRLSVTGILQKALVRGVAADEMSLDLTGTDGKKVFFASNHARLANKGTYRPEYKFEKNGTSIFMVRQRKNLSSMGKGGGSGIAEAIIGKLASKGDERSSSSSGMTTEKNLLFREGSQATLEGTFKYINASSVMLDWHPPQT
jgi:hypothetical protein